MTMDKESDVVRRHRLVTQSTSTDDNGGKDDDSIDSSDPHKAHKTKKTSSSTDDSLSDDTPTDGTQIMSEWNITDDDFYNITAANHTSLLPVEQPQSDSWAFSVIATFLGLAIVFICAHRVRSSRRTYHQIQDIPSEQT